MDSTFSQDPQQTNSYRPEPVGPVVHHREHYRREHDLKRVTWATISAYIAGVAGIVLAAATLTTFLLFRSATTAQITELRQEVATAQAAQADTAGTVAGLSNRLKGITGNLNAVGDLVTPFTTVCSTDLTGPNGPAQYDFLCRPH